tara:strand:+ start:1260 stop:1793 length:534 start_codon:yes stop_codon:yes gene_type:complete
VGRIGLIQIIKGTFMTKLFRMPNSLEHFKGEDEAYFSLFAKSLSIACRKITDLDYTAIFHKWIDDFLPKDEDKIKSRMEDWVYIKRKLSILIKEKNLEQERLNGEVGYYEKNTFVGNESLRLRAQQIENNERFLRKHFQVSADEIKTNIHSNQAKKYFAENYNACVGTEEYARDLGY